MELQNGSFYCVFALIALRLIFLFAPGQPDHEHGNQDQADEHGARSPQVGMAAFFFLASSTRLKQQFNAAFAMVVFASTLQLLFFFMRRLVI
ncbi:MAG TPA: hypothetical protein VMZ49_03420 [Patescibacteria group bacterium]|nr:hypothetical protein [Patescibacteria group bacterium]